MSNETKGPGAEPHPTPEAADTGAAPGTAAGAAPAPEVATQPAAAAEVSPAAADAGGRIAELEGQIADLTDRLLRAHAEMDNIRKRGERERQDTQKYAVSRFAKDLLTVGDNMKRAIAAVPADTVAGNDGLKSLLDGVTMTDRELHSIFERHGIKRLDPKGEAFNPHFHQAVMEQQNPEVPSGTIVQVFEAGYVIEDRVLRPASVVVARGGPKSTRPSGSDASIGELGSGAGQRGNDGKSGPGNGESQSNPDAGAV